MRGAEVQRGVPLTTVGDVARAYSPNEIKSVADYLAKPVPIVQATWNTSQTAGTALFGADTWAGVHATTMWVNKLTGFYGLRATLKVTLVLNATPFHQGRLCLSYYPAAKLAPEKVLGHISHRTAITQLPGIEISAADESATLSIPLVTPQRFIELTNNPISWGNVYLHVLSPLKTGLSGSTDVSYTVWYSLHDVELFGQTSNPVVAQSTTLRSSKVRRRRAPPSEEEEKPLSKVLGAGAMFAGSLTTIPSLAPYAGPTSWALNALKGAATAFGWSKPLGAQKPNFVSSNYHWYTTTADGLDNSIPLSLSHDAKLAVLDDVSSGSSDEMSINFIKQQWAYLDEFTIATSDLTNKQLYSLALAPKNLVNTVTAPAETYMTPVAYLSTLYQLYRGGLEICFKMVKTAFHAGSIAVTYVPGTAPTTLTVANTNYCFRTIIDIQEGEQVCLRVPYMLPLDYFETGNSYGRIYVHLINSLRAPETVRSDINVLVYVRGAPDLEFQSPDSPYAVHPIVAQGGDVEATGEIVCDTVGGENAPTQGVSFAEHSASESPQSILQLVKRYMPMALDVSETTQSVNFRPWVLSASRLAAGTYTPPPFVYEPILSLVAAPYAFYRGSVRIRATGPRSNVTTNLAVMRRRISGSGAQWVQMSSDTVVNMDLNVRLPLSHPLAVNGFCNGGVSVQMPYQGPYRMAPVTWLHKSGQTTPYEVPRNNVEVVFGTARDFLLSRAVGDDFQCLFWVGIPRLTTA